MHQNLELFQKKSNCPLTPAEENNEVNRFLGWAIFSSVKKIYGESFSYVSRKQVLLAVMMRKIDMDDEYLTKYNDSHMVLINQGELTLMK